MKNEYTRKNSMVIKRQKLADKLLLKIAAENETRLHPYCPICGEEYYSHNDKECNFFNYKKLCEKTGVL